VVEMVDSTKIRIKDKNVTVFRVKPFSRLRQAKTVFPVFIDFAECFFFKY
jgi:hypothetical protein